MAARLDGLFEDAVLCLGLPALGAGPAWGVHAINGLAYIDNSSVLYLNFDWHISTPVYTRCKMHHCITHSAAM